MHKPKVNPNSLVIGVDDGYLDAALNVTVSGFDQVPWYKFLKGGIIEHIYSFAGDQGQDHAHHPERVVL